VARTGVHGANRLASNSLLEGLVFADRAGRSLARKLRSKVARVGPSPWPEIPDLQADAASEEIRLDMRNVMTANVGVQRSESSLLHAERELERLTAAAPSGAWRTHNQLVVAGLITRAARGRRESRGGHRRSDYPPERIRREAV
jgi:aspartate oxidase